MKARNQLEVYEDRRGEFRWSLRNMNNHNITADGAEGYSTPSNARRAARKAGLAMIVASFKFVVRPFQNGDHRHGR